VNRMHRAVAALAGLAVLAASGCSISVNPVSTGPMRADSVNVPLPADLTKPWDVELRPGAAGVTVSSDGAGVIDGMLEYNVDQWKPEVTTSSQRVVIRQADFNGIPPANARNDWNLKLGPGVPINLYVSAGAVNGHWELGGLSLRSLTWKQGAADTTIRFSQPNLVKLEVLDVDAGASMLALEGLGNANVYSGTINIGAGTLSLRFNGKLTHDVDLTIKGGAAAITIDSGGNLARFIRSSALTMITSGDWSQSEDMYVTPGRFDAAEPKVTIHSELAAATVNLVVSK
jgi:hypothetical protein